MKKLKPQTRQNVYLYLHPAKNKFVMRVFKCGNNLLLWFTRSFFKKQDATYDWTVVWAFNCGSNLLIIIAELWKAQLLNIKRWNSKPITRRTFVPLIIGILFSFHFYYHQYYFYFLLPPGSMHSINLWNTNNFHIKGETQGNSRKSFLLLCGVLLQYLSRESSCCLCGSVTLL